MKRLLFALVLVSLPLWGAQCEVRGSIADQANSQSTSVDLLLQPQFLESIITNFGELSPRMQKFIRSGALMRGWRSPLARQIDGLLRNSGHSNLSDPARIEISLLPLSHKLCIWIRWVALRKKPGFFSFLRPPALISVGDYPHAPQSVFVQILAGALHAGLLRVAEHSHLSADDLELAGPILSPHLKAMADRFGLSSQNSASELIFKLDHALLREAHLAGRDTKAAGF